MEKPGTVCAPPTATNLDPTTAEILAAAVHDLKGPAGRLRVLADLLLRGAAGADADSRALLGHVSESTKALDLAIEGLRSYAEICGHSSRFEPVDLTVLVAAAVSNLHPEIQAAGAEVSYTGLPTARVDRSLMLWMFQELLSNALRFRGSDPPRIQISAAAEPDAWMVSIIDNGPGIEADMAERAFRPFKKLTSKGGAGMGLTICRQIARIHGGEIWSEPRTGGAEICFRISESACNTDHV